MAKIFQVIKGTFGGIDEQATTDYFESFVGGVNRAQLLFSIWKNVYEYPAKRIKYFRDRAEHERFTKEQIDAFLIIKDI